MIRESHTPLELEERAMELEGEGRSSALRRVHDLYERARYMPQTVTTGDLASMREAVLLLGKERG